VSAAQYGNIAPNSAAQYNGLLGGNQGLTPEKSDTYSVGFVFQPSFVPNLTMSVDWFDIKVLNTIGPIGADTILANCITTGNPTYCDAIHRDANGSLWKTPQGFVADTNVNFGSLTTKGIDIKGNYRQPLPVGSLVFGLEGTKLINLDTQPLTGGPAYDCTGFFGTICGASNPAWRHVLNTTWSTPWDALDITLRWRYIGSAESELDSTNPQLQGKPALPLTSHISAYNYLDLSGQFALGKNVRMQVGINNLTDKDPPIITSGGGGFGSDCPTITANLSSCNGNTWPGTYDALGRFIFVHFTAQF